MVEVAEEMLSLDLPSPVPSSPHLRLSVYAALLAIQCGNQYVPSSFAALTLSGADLSLLSSCSESEL